VEDPDPVPEPSLFEPADEALAPAEDPDPEDPEVRAALRALSAAATDLRSADTAAWAELAWLRAWLQVVGLAWPPAVPPVEPDPPPAPGLASGPATAGLGSVVVVVDEVVVVVVGVVVAGAESAHSVVAAARAAEACDESLSAAVWAAVSAPCSFSI
jgi:hypothetical protein